MAKDKVTIEAEIDNAAYGMLNKAFRSQSEIIEESIKLNLDFSIETVLNKHGYKAIKIDVTDHLVKHIDTTLLTGEYCTWINYECKDFFFKGKFIPNFREIHDPAGNVYECTHCYCPSWHIDSFIEGCEFDCDINEVEQCFLT